MEYINNEKNIKIEADTINIGKSVNLGRNLSVKVKGEFHVNDFSDLGENTIIRGNNVIIGKHFFTTTGLNIGGGGWQNPGANLKIGDRCVIHNSLINICEPVEIGNDVGFSAHVDVLTHGFWLSVLEGFPATFSGVRIGNGVIVGHRSLIMMGVEIADQIVIGAYAVVTKTLKEMGIYAGVPAKKIKDIIPLTYEQRIQKISEIVNNYAAVAKYHQINPKIKIDFPYININNFRFNVETFEYEGIEDIETDDFRDYIRRWGIRIYTERPFKSCFNI
ncbi:MAG: acyltransferase [Bacteroidia bacterium]|nr:acyltransferase [Bacteroidia bacterium]